MIIKYLKKYIQAFTDKLPPNVLTLNFRLKILISLVLIIVVGGPLFFLVYQVDKNYQELSINMIETTSQALYQSIFEGFMENDKETIQRNIELLSTEPNIQLVRIFEPGGKIIYSSRIEEINQNVSDLTEERLAQYELNNEQETFFKNGNTYSHHHAIYVQKECLPCHTDQGAMIAVMDVHVGLSQSEQIYSSIKRLTIISAILIVVILWIILNFMYEGQIESRLRKIINGFGELARGNLNFQIQMPGKHELAMLSQKFNQTVAQLRQAKDKEDQFVQERLERADRLVTLGEVVAEIAHEVNNPASVILSRAEFLKDELKDNHNNGKYSDDLDIIIQQTERIAETTRSILHYARKLPQTFSEMDLNRAIEKSLKILDPRIRKSSTVIHFKPFGKPALIKGNVSQLEQVFCNLINNSLDATSGRQGKVSVEVQYRHKNGKRPEYHIFFEDNGPGVPQDYRNQIFSPFFTTKADGKGTGLGLYIVRNIIANHNGEIYLLDRNKSGASFLIELGAIDGKN